MVKAIKPAKPETCPKRPLSGYFRFLQGKRSELAAANPEASVATIAKLGGHAWSALSDAQKKPFQDAAAEEKAIYDKKMQVYTKSEAYSKFQEDMKAFKKSKNKKFKKDKNAPKRAPTSFMIFSNEVRKGLMEENPELTITTVSKKIGAAWAALSEEQKAEYAKKKDAAKKVADAKIAAYKKTEAFQKYQEDKAVWEAKNSPKAKAKLEKEKAKAKKLKEKAKLEKEKAKAKAKKLREKAKKEKAKAQAKKLRERKRKASKKRSTRRAAKKRRV